MKQWHSRSRKFACFIHLTHTMKKKKTLMLNQHVRLKLHSHSNCLVSARKELKHLPPPSHDPQDLINDIIIEIYLPGPFHKTISRNIL